MSNNTSYNSAVNSNEHVCIIYPTKQDCVVSPENTSKSNTKEEAKGLYFRKKSSSNCKSPDGNSQQNTRWSSKQFQDDFLSDDTSEEEEQQQEDKSKDSVFQKRLQQQKSEWNSQKKNFYKSRDNRSLGLCDQDEDEINEDEDNQYEDNINENFVSSNEVEIGEEKVDSIYNKLQEIPTCLGLPFYNELDRQVKSLKELPSQVLQKQNFLLGEKIPNYFENMNMDDGIDEIDEIQEDVDGGRDSSILNHRKKLQINPIFHCNEVRLRFRVDSYNTGDENTQCQENDDIIVKNVQLLKINHAQLKQNKLNKKAQYHKSCINL